MSLDERIKSTVDAALQELRTRVETDMKGIVEQIVATASTERDEARNVARREALEEAAEQGRREVADAEARVRAELEQVLADARNEERKQSAQHRSEALAGAETRLQQALNDAYTRGAQALKSADAKAAQALQEATASVRASEREAGLGTMVRLLESVRGLDGAASLSEVMDALGRAIGREASRTAVLVVRNERLVGWKLAGFGISDGQPKTIDLGLSECGVIGLATSTARTVTTRDNETAAEGPGFADLPGDRAGVAVPVIVGGRVVAVVYGDVVSASANAIAHEHPSGWSEALELLARHAARCLEALTVQKVAATAAPRFWVPPSGSSGSKPVAADSAPQAGGLPA